MYSRYRSLPNLAGLEPNSRSRSRFRIWPGASASLYLPPSRKKFGSRLAVLIGTLLYSAGLALSSFSVTPLGHQLLEVMVGFGIAGTGFGVILAVVGRAAPDSNRSLALGIATAAGSVGQIIGPPFAAVLLAYMNWSMVFIVFSVLILSVLFALPMLGRRDQVAVEDLEESLSEILILAFKDPSYTMVFLGVLLVRVPNRILHCSLPRYGHRDVQPGRSGRISRHLRRHDDRGARRRIHRLDRFHQCDRNGACRCSRARLPQKAPAGFHLYVAYDHLESCSLHFR